MHILTPHVTNPAKKKEVSWLHLKPRCQRPWNHVVEFQTSPDIAFFLATYHTDRLLIKFPLDHSII